MTTKKRSKPTIATMNISMPAAQADYVRKRVRAAGYGSVSDYFRDLIRQDQNSQSEGERALELFSKLGDSVAEEAPAYGNKGGDRSAAATALRSAWELYKLGAAMAEQREKRQGGVSPKWEKKALSDDYLVDASHRLEKILKGT